jgi:hypothetical protein
MTAKNSVVSPRKAAGCMMLFALPFAAMGFGMAGYGASVASKAMRAQSWVETPAVITSVDLKRGNKGSRRAVATYEYEFAGQKYTGDKVSFSGGSDGLGRFQTLAHEELNGHKQQRKPFPAYVNPENPREAVLYRNVRWEMMLLFCGMGALFGSAGVGIFTGSLVTWLRQSGSTAPAASNSERPWESRSDWAAGRIGPSDAARAAVPATTAVAVSWLLASAPIVITFPLMLQYAESRWAWLTLILPAIALLIIALAIYFAIRRRRFGESIFEMASVPGVIGGPLTGVVRIPRVFEPENGFRIRLLCMEQRQNTKSDSEHERAIWQNECFAANAMTDGAGGMAVPVLMAIPYRSRPTSDSAANSTIRWLLEIFAELPGINFKTEFEVPVFKTAESRADFELDQSLTADFSSPPDNDLFLREAGIIKQRASYGGVRIVFPAFRNIVSSIIVTVVAVAMIGGAWLMYQHGVFLLFPIVFGLVGALFALVAVDSWLYRSVVEASTKGLSVRGGLLGIGRTRTYQVDEVRRFRSAEGMSSGKNVWCNISVETASDKRRTIGKSIKSKLAEQAVIAELNAAMARDIPVTQKRKMTDELKKDAG